MKKPILTIIIPVYNPNNNLFVGCLKSIEKIKSEEVETIIVNDGSEDNIEHIIQKHIKNLNNVRYIKQKNMGVSVARNCALKLARGKYVAFIDSDDAVIAPAIDAFCNELKNENADFIITDHIYKNGKICKKIRISKTDINNAKSRLMCCAFPSAPWSKIYKNETIRKYNICFPKNIKIGEDLIFIYNFLAKSTAIKQYHKPFYIYNVNNSGAMSNTRIRGDVIFALDDIKEDNKDILSRKFYEALQSQNDLRIDRGKYLNGKMLLIFLFKSNFKLKTKAKALYSYINRSKYDIYLRCYLKKNLGDDLFMLCAAERYKNKKILCISDEKYDIRHIPKNIDIKHITRLKYYYSRLINKIYGGNSLDSEAAKNASIIIQIGGSMFIEKTNIAHSYKQLRSEYSFVNNKETYLIGSNIGPYSSDDYLLEVRKIIRKASFTCVRDQKSFSLINDIPNTAYAPDIIFSLSLDKYIKSPDQKRKKTAIISVINPYTKRDQIPQYINPEIYYTKMAEIINELDSLGYNITLASFCKAEGDEEAIEYIIKSKLLNLDASKIELMLYDGNIDDALNILGACDLIVGSRFHANILGIIMGKNIIPISYNEKTKNMLKDLDFKGLVIDMESLKNLNTKLIKSNLNNKARLTSLRKQSEKHFSMLDDRLKR